MRFAAFPSGRMASRRAVHGCAAALAVATGLVIGTAATAGATTHPITSVTTPVQPAKEMTVPIHLNAFMPPSATVTVGQAVTWLNQDDVLHTVTTTSAPVKFDSGVFAKGKSFTYTFAQPGVYKYYCAVHPNMQGEITVVDKAAPAPANGKPTVAASAPGVHTTDDPVTSFMDPFMAHMRAAHFNRGVGGQVQDIAEFDRWTGNHQALFRRMLDYEVGSGSVAATTQVGRVFLQHMDAAHWNRSPLGQVSDIVNFDSWNKSHLAMFRIMFDDVVGKESALGKAPGTSVFMQHMDAAHWNQSANEQAAAITDDFSNWMAGHVAMFQAMGSSVSNGSSGGPSGH